MTNKKILFAAALALLAFAMLSCSRGGVGKDTNDTVGTGAETRSPYETYPFETNTANVGEISVSANSSSLNFNAGGVGFSVIFGSGDCYSNGSGQRFMSKSGKSSVTEKSESRIVTTSEWSGASVVTEYDLSSGCVSYRQSASVKKGGISAVGVTFRVSDAHNIIVPYQNGIRLTKKNPDLGVYVSKSQNYQYGLQMQMFIIEGKKGGALVYCDDDFTQFKQLTVDHSTGYFSVICETVPQAPFTEYRSFDAVSWKIVPYVGDWTSASAIYRDFVTEKFGLEEADRYRPDWVDDIQLYYATDMHDRAELAALASRVDASKVILHVPDWRTNLYDVNWPDYTPQPALKEMIEYAHSLGFKVQLHCNMFGFQPELEDYQRFAKYHSRDSFSGKLIYQDFSDTVRHYRFASINPASSEWRKYIISRLVAAVRETGADALHLDQSLISYNDANGYIDGLTSLQGTVLYMKELAEALPDGVAIGGEGITDFNAVYSSFLQSHAYAINSSEHTWVESCGDQIVPLAASVYTDVRMCYWPGTPLTGNHDYYLAWYRFGTYAGEMPTIMRESAQTLSSGDPVTEMVLAEANWFMENEPVRVYSDWTDETVARYYLKNGTYARAVRNSKGYVLYGNENDRSSVVSQIVFGAAEVTTPLAVKDWIAHGDGSVFGLDPSKYYVLSGGASFSGRVHISSMTAGAYISQYSLSDSMIQITFVSDKTDMVEFTVKASSGISSVVCNSRECETSAADDGYVTALVPAGSTAYILLESSGTVSLPVSLYSTPFTTYYESSSGKITLADTTSKGTGSFAGKLVKRFTVSVPQRTMNSLEFAVSLPESPALLKFAFGTADSVKNPVPVLLDLNGKIVWSGEITAAGVRTDAEVDLSEYAGKTVMIRLCADCRGLSGVTRKIFWIDPVIIER
ncbi:MAG: hypothetical protein IKS28_00915 [Clostridia bacterium]|nr:hypothetical protein [Clostridia bacterium]